MAVERGLSDLKEALKGDDLDRVRKAKDELLKASHKLAEQVYKDAQSKAEHAEAPGKAGANGKSHKGKKDDEVVDAEVVDEEKGDS